MATTPSSPYPVIVCGLREEVGRVVIETLKPEFETIHMILSTSAGCAEIPLILSGQPAPSNSSLGTRNYDRIPVAVVTGAGYDADAVVEMMAACHSDSKAVRVPWLRPDPEKQKDAPRGPTPEYAKVVGQRVKDAIFGLMGTSGDQAVDKAGEVVFY